MDTSALKKFAQNARKELIEIVSTKVDYYLSSDSVEIRAKEEQVNELKQEVKKQGKEQLIEKVAYTWFNRFCALRFMDVNGYTPVGILSPAEGHTQPEMFLEAKEGKIRDDFGSDKARAEISELISGKTLSTNPQAEAYRKLLVLACNYYNSLMPFLFEKLDHYTELLLPDDLLSEDSIIEKVKEILSEDNCQDVEIIGWLYQFYISEKKDEVFAGLKKNKKVTPENIPAATQLFTPNWIVKYLVENSIGRLWMLNNPSSALIGKMKYYIKPEEDEIDFLAITSPEEIKVCDPACGSGHMLTYAFDILYLIYEEKGYAPSEIPSKILSSNLYGLEIDERAGELAAFALTMKARSKQRSFFKKSVQPNICVLEKIKFDKQELKDYMEFIGIDLFSASLKETLSQFEYADNLGSLIKPMLLNVKDTLELLRKKSVAGEMFLSLTHEKVLKVLRQVEYLISEFFVVITNPPYMSQGSMNSELKKILVTEYPSSKADLMTCFMERILELVPENGYWGMINLPSWMFLSSFEVFRKELLDKVHILNFLHLGRGIFGSDFGSVAFVCKQTSCTIDNKGTYRRLFDKHVKVRSVEEIERLFFNKSYGSYISSQEDFKQIPGSPIAYWASDRVYDSFANLPSLEDVGLVRQGASTSDNNRFLRYWYEVEHSKIGFCLESTEKACLSDYKWFPYNKGGNFRKWYGNHDYVINYENDGEELKEFQSTLNQGWTARLKSREYYFQPSVSWPKLTAGTFSARYYPKGFIFDVAGCSYFPGTEVDPKQIVAFLNSIVGKKFLEFLSPTLNFEIEHIKKIPYKAIKDSFKERLYEISKNDWDTRETSWAFNEHPVMRHKEGGCLRAAFEKYLQESNDITEEMKTLEEEINQHFISAYNMSGEVKPDVSFGEISLFCNARFLYGENKSSAELSKLFFTDLSKELISYAVGCMFGRYSISGTGLITNDETIESDTGSFHSDSDNVLSFFEEDWFNDDVTEYFKSFLKVTFGEEKLAENISFMEENFGKSLSKYMVNDFYSDHIKRYNKRPIYFMFSSPKGSFNALIYLHRYSPDQVSIILNDYLREFKAKIEAKKSHLEGVNNSSQSEKTKAVKEIERLKKVIVELDDYERDVLYPLAAEKIEIDLDDGVKVNYPKFGKALKKITGLS